MWQSSPLLLDCAGWQELQPQEARLLHHRQLSTRSQSPVMWWGFNQVLLQDQWVYMGYWFYASERTLVRVARAQVYLIDGSQSWLLPDLKYAGSRLRKGKEVELSVDDKALSKCNCHHVHQHQHKQHLEKGEAKVLLLSQSQVAQGGSWQTRLSCHHLRFSCVKEVNLDWSQQWQSCV